MDKTLSKLIKPFRDEYWKRRLSRIRPIPRFRAVRLDPIFQEIQDGIDRIKSGQARITTFQNRRLLEKFTLKPIYDGKILERMFRPTLSNDMHLPFEDFVNCFRKSYFKPAKRKKRFRRRRK